MVANPADLEQPRAESPAYTPRRDIAFERYRFSDEQNVRSETPCLSESA